MSKYNHYQSNFPDHDLDPIWSRAETAYQLLNIANELAEANRLKLIDLKIKCQNFDMPDKPDLLIRGKELEDLA